MSRQQVVWTGAWALVTGASSGIGEEFARALAARGSNLVLVARSSERLTRLAEDLARAHGVRTRHVSVDLATPGGSEELLSALSAMGVFIELVVNNAGFGSAGPLSTLDAGREARMVSLNCGAVAALSRGLLEPMLLAKRGGIINVASTAAFQPTPYMATYGATKAFVLSFTLALAAELAGTGVRALAFCPGPVRTGFQAAAGLSRPGIRLLELTAAKCVERGLAAYERGDELCVPGVLDVAQTLAVGILPRGLVRWATTRTMRRLGRTGVIR